MLISSYRCPSGACSGENNYIWTESFITAFINNEFVRKYENIAVAQIVLDH